MGGGGGREVVPWCVALPGEAAHPRPGSCPADDVVSEGWEVLLVPVAVARILDQICHCKASPLSTVGRDTEALNVD